MAMNVTNAAMAAQGSQLWPAVLAQQHEQLVAKATARRIGKRARLEPPPGAAAALLKGLLSTPVTKTSARWTEEVVYGRSRENAAAAAAAAATVAAAKGAGEGAAVRPAVRARAAAFAGKETARAAGGAASLLQDENVAKARVTAAKAAPPRIEGNEPVGPFIAVPGVGTVGAAAGAAGAARTTAISLSASRPAALALRIGSEEVRVNRPLPPPPPPPFELHGGGDSHRLTQSCQRGKTGLPLQGYLVGVAGRKRGITDPRARGEGRPS